jgi:hypothetical protein
MTRERDMKVDLARDDAEIRFRDGSSKWTDAEIRTVDDAFCELQRAAGSALVLTRVDGPMTFEKRAADDPMRLDRQGAATPVGPSQRCEKSPVVQDASWRLGHRICLLKGCERSFQPQHRLSRYCNKACRAAACRWHRQQANRRYRASEQGQCRRREQACRYRERRRQREPEHGPPDEGGEGYPIPGGAEAHAGPRPGCYARFVKTRRSPLQGHLGPATGGEDGLPAVAARRLEAVTPRRSPDQPCAGTTG